jgi:tetratricopeptide (TPR) repeat protein
LPVELFTAATVKQYLTAAWGEASFIEDVARHIHEHTEGNALFVVHVVDELVNQGIVRKEEGKWRLKGDVARITIPRTLQALIEKDVRQLPDMEQRALETASVAGMAFAVAVVAAALKKPVEEVEAVYEEITRKNRFLQEDTPVEWPDGIISGRYQFRHRLYKEVLYQRVAEARRMRLHRQIAEREEERYGDRAEDIAGELAVHFEQGRLYLKAAHYLQLAARNALRRRSAPVEAIALSQQGLELLRRLAETLERTSEEIELQITLGNALIAAGSLSDPRVGQAFARAQALCEQVNNLSQRFRALFWLRRYHNHRGENREAASRAHELVQLAEQENDPALLTLAYLSIGETLWYGANLVKAKGYLEKSIASYDPVQHHSLTALCGTDPISGSMIYRAICLWFLGYLDQALKLANEALTLAQDLDHPFSVAFIKLHTTIASHALRKPEEVQSRAEETIKLSTEYGFVFYRALGAILKGWALVMQGNEKGIAYASEALKKCQAIEVGVGRTWALALLADTCRILGQSEEGLEAIREALGIVNRTGEHFYEAELYRLKGELLLQQASRHEPKSRKRRKPSTSSCQ